MRLSNIYKSYKEHVIMRDFNAEIEDGIPHLIMGASGCGKTTLLRLLIGLEEPDAGEIHTSENPIFSAAFQEDRLCENLSVFANIYLPHMANKSRNSDHCAKEELLHLLANIGLANLENKKVSTLSGGMKRRVALLRAVMAPSNIVVFDEPLKGLDEETEHRTMAVLTEKLKGKTVLWVTHNASDVQYFNEYRLWDFTSSGLTARRIAN